MAPAIWLVTLDGILHVKIEDEHGAWKTVIREVYDGGPISHIVEPSAIASVLATKPAKGGEELRRGAARYAWWRQNIETAMDDGLGGMAFESQLPLEIMEADSGTLMDAIADAALEAPINAQEKK